MSTLAPFGSTRALCAGEIASQMMKQFPKAGSLPSLRATTMPALSTSTVKPSVGVATPSGSSTPLKASSPLSRHSMTSLVDCVRMVGQNAGAQIPGTLVILRNCLALLMHLLSRFPQALIVSVAFSKIRPFSAGITWAIPQLCSLRSNSAQYLWEVHLIVACSWTTRLLVGGMTVTQTWSPLPRGSSLRSQQVLDTPVPFAQMGISHAGTVPEVLHQLSCRLQLTLSLLDSTPRQRNP